MRSTGIICRTNGRRYFPVSSPGRRLWRCFPPVLLVISMELFKWYVSIHPFIFSRYIFYSVYLFMSLSLTLTICLAIYQFISLRLPNCLSVYIFSRLLSISLFPYPSINLGLLAIYLTTYLTIYISISQTYPSIYLSINTSLNLPLCLPSYISTCLSIYLSVYLSMLSVSQFFSQSVYVCVYLPGNLSIYCLTIYIPIDLFIYINR